MARTCAAMLVPLVVTLVLLPATLSDEPLLREPETPAMLVHRVLKDAIEVTVRNVFSQEQDLQYSVIVTTDPSDPDITEMTKLHTWRQFRNQRGERKSYMAMPPCRWFFTYPSRCYGLTSWGKKGRARRHLPRHHHRRNARHRRANQRTKRATVTFTVGGGDCRFSATADHCNGPLLDPGTFYLALRAFSAFGGFQDSAFTEGIDIQGGSRGAAPPAGGNQAPVNLAPGNEDEDSDEISSKENVVLLILAILAFLLLLCAIGVIIFIMCRRRRNEPDPDPLPVTTIGETTVEVEALEPPTTTETQTPPRPTHNYFLRSSPHTNHTCVQEPRVDPEGVQMEQAV